MMKGNNDNGMYFVYKHTVPSGKVYIGITNNPKVRWRSSGAAYKACTYFYRAIKKYGWDNITHEILESGLSVSESKEREIFYIEKFESNNPKNGYNLTIGGNYPPPNLHTKEAIEKSKATRKKNLSLGIHGGNYGKKFSQEWREHISIGHIGVLAGEKNPNYGKHLPLETRRKIAIANTGRKMPDKTRNAIYPARRKPILQYTLDGEFVKRWDCTASASKELGICNQNISACLLGQYKQSGGFIWKFEKDVLLNQNPPIEKRQPSSDSILL